VLAYLFIAHGIKAIVLSPGFLGLVMEFGFGITFAKISLFAVGVIDIAVAVALFVYKKPLVFIYAGLWPLVPTFMTLFAYGVFFWQEMLIAPLMGVLAYWAFIGFKAKTKKQKVKT
jgi:hypothetical protein